VQLNLRLSLSLAEMFWTNFSIELGKDKM
jgi:hypothetical protein